MKIKIAIYFAALGLVFGASALDNTIVNDFWNTTGYVNASTSTVQTVSSTLVVDTKSQEVVATPAPSAFDTHARGFVIIIH